MLRAHCFKSAPPASIRELVAFLSLYPNVFCWYRGAKMPLRYLAHHGQYGLWFIDPLGVQHMVALPGFRGSLFRVPLLATPLESLEPGLLFNRLGFVVELGGKSARFLYSAQPWVRT